ncbi:MAG: cytochrome C oxidase subunit IV family protein [candidate division NC10 bacterium]|jgi:caa(3)-type oxidase subunit IV|nr:cytochrome C oxidase subunit IV family protein [candidate division NC10 bacterium]
MARERVHPNYVAVWLWLVGLLIASVVISYLPISRGVAVFLIFVAAFVKAVLVALDYMHLRFERPLIYAMAIIPLAIFFVLWIVLYPDIALR